MTTNRRKYDLKYTRSPKGRFCDQKKQARKRGIGWGLTFAQWWGMWEPHWAQRGWGLDRMVMARNGDAGPYAVGNVRIITNRQNLGEQERRPRAHMARMSALGHAARWGFNIEEEPAS